MSMNIALDLTERELLELRQRTKATDCGDAASRAAREFLRTCRLRELTLMAGQLDYDEQAWRALDEAELSGPQLFVDVEPNDG
ncbi:MAG: hypothetical protein NTY19_52125 [Planctomycetota bacterium]|nr:hypothetical protein [Planctomycetota bacterium]